jgi:hypothetical protein
MSLMTPSKKGKSNQKAIHWPSVKEKSLSIASIFITFVKLFHQCKAGTDIDFNLSAKHLGLSLFVEIEISGQNP